MIVETDRSTAVAPDSSTGKTPARNVCKVIDRGRFPPHGKRGLLVVSPKPPSAVELQSNGRVCRPTQNAVDQAGKSMGWPSDANQILLLIAMDCSPN